MKMTPVLPVRASSLKVNSGHARSKLPCQPPRTVTNRANRSLPRTVREAEGLVDRRRWTSFLTWAFVLAEMSGRDGFLAPAAHAGDQDGTPSPHGSGDATPVVNSLPNIGVSTAADGPDAINYQHASLANLPAPAGLSSELAEAKTAPGADVLSQSGVGGGGAGHNGGSASVSEVATDASGHIDLGAPGLAALTGDMFGLGLHIDLGNTVHVLLDGPSHLTSTTGNLLSTLGPVVSLVGSELDPSGANAADVGSPGQLSFADDLSFAVSDELATPNGGYTDYGMALNLGVPISRTALGRRRCTPMGSAPVYSTAC